MLTALLRQITHKDIQKTAMAALEEYKTFVFEVESITTWLSKVLKNPHPIILQAYANWSLPCRKLTPILQKKALVDEGKWHYARMDIEEVQDLASALEITRVPTLFLINRGNSMNRIEGIITEEALDEFIEDAKLVAGLVSDETVFQGLLLAGEDFIKEKKYHEAIRSFQEALSYKEFGEKYKERCWEGLIKAYFAMGDLKKAKEAFGMFGNAEISERLKEIQSKIDDMGKIEGEVSMKVEELRGRLERDQQNFEEIGKVAVELHGFGKHEEAIEVALELIVKEKSFKGFGQKAIVKILSDLGNDHVLTKPTRKRLQGLFIKYS